MKAKLVKKRLTGIEEHKVFSAIETIVINTEEVQLTGTEMYEAVCDTLDFIPPAAAVESRVKSLGYQVAKRYEHKSHAKMLGEIVALALRRMADGTPNERLINERTEQLLAGDIDGAYADRGPLVP